LPAVEFDAAAKHTDPAAQSVDVQHGSVQKLVPPLRPPGTFAELAQMSLSHDAGPLQGHVTPRHPESTGPTS
jgi:hypothetical protein